MRCLFVSSDLRFILSPAAAVGTSMLIGRHFIHLWLAAFPVPSVDILNLQQVSQPLSNPWSLRENDMLDCLTANVGAGGQLNLLHPKVSLIFTHPSIPH